MNLVINNPALLMDRWQTVELMDAAGATASLDDGCLWITMDGDPRDIVLGPGESWIVERNGRTLVHAELPSKVRFTAPQKKPDALKKFRLPIGKMSTAITQWIDRQLATRWVPRY